MPAPILAPQSDWVMPTSFPNLAGAEKISVDLETCDPWLATKGPGWCFPHGHVAGVSVAVVNYALCPAVSVEEIVRQMLRAARWLWLHAGDYGMSEERLFVSGHSAGGHLAAMLMAALWPIFDRQLPPMLFKGALAISGIYDLRPLVQVPWLNADLRLDETQARRLSPAFLPAATRAPLMTCVGGDESSEFKRQNALLGERWRKVLAGDLAMPGRNHFSVVDGLADPNSALYAGARRLMGLDR